MNIHSISNTNITIEVNSLGAELISFKKKDREYLWQSDPEVWARYAPVLFPIVGKLKTNEFVYDNRNYHLPQHGFARDKEFTMVAKSSTSLEYELTADKGTLENYPFHFSLRILYELNGNKLTVKYRIYNPDKKDLLFSIGAHPGFNCSFGSEALSDHYLEFDNKTELVCERLQDGLLSGKQYVVKLNNHRLQLNPQLFENDALVLRNAQVKKVVLGSNKSGEKLTMTCSDWPYFGIWTKKGSDAFVCLEPWQGIADSTLSNGQIQKKEGINRLEPYKYFETEFNIELKN